MTHTTSDDRREDVFLYHSDDPHTAVPDWVALSPDLSLEERNLIHRILIGMKSVLPPTQEELAQQSGVHYRTIARWLVSLRDKGYIVTYRAGRRTFYRIRTAIPDTMRISDLQICDPHAITDLQISDLQICDPHAITDLQICDPHGVRYQQGGCQQLIEHSDAENKRFSAKPITDPHVGVGVGSTSHKERSPTNTARRPLKTALARWLRHQGVVGAYHFDDPALDFETYRRDFERKRGDGWTISLIVDSWLTAPLESDPAAVQLGLIADELPDELPDEPAAPVEPAPAALTADEAQARYERLQRERGRR